MERRISPRGDTPCEGEQRERLAAFFLSSPPYDTLDGAGQEVYRQRLRQLGGLELTEIRQAAGSERPMTWGDIVPPLQSAAVAAQRLAAGLGQPILLFPAANVAMPFFTLWQPRLLSTGVAALLRAAVSAAPRQPVWVRLREQASCLIVSATAQQPIPGERDYPALGQILPALREIARLHGGSLAICENTIGFSFARAAEPPAGTSVGSFSYPSAESLLADTLSPVWTGFFAFLPEMCGAADEKEAEEPDEP